MTVTEKRVEYLKTYRNLCIKINSLQEQKDSIIEEMVNVRSQNYDGMPRSGKQCDLSDHMVRLENILKSIDTAKAECLAIKISIESSILKMKNGLESALLHKRYILFKSWDTISKELGYERTQVYRIHGKALQHIDIGGYVSEKE